MPGGTRVLGGTGASSHLPALQRRRHGCEHRHCHHPACWSQPWLWLHMCVCVCTCVSGYACACVCWNRGSSVESLPVTSCPRTWG